MTGAPPKVFISYSHDTVEHQERVLGLADRLRADGIDAEIDQYNTAPPEGWPLWCERQIAAADIVLMVCTETYQRRVSGNEERGQGLGVVWEARIIRQLLYDASAVSNKFVPVLFSDASPEQIPTPIKGWTRYVVDTEDGYEELYRRLTGQPRLLRPALGKIRPMPTRTRQWPESTMEAASSSPSPASAPAPDDEAKPQSPVEAERQAAEEQQREAQQPKAARKNDASRRQRLKLMTAVGLVLVGFAGVVIWQQWPTQEQPGLAETAHKDQQKEVAPAPVPAPVSTRPGQGDTTPPSGSPSDSPSPPIAESINLLAPENGGKVFKAPSEAWLRTIDNRERGSGFLFLDEEAVYMFKDGRPATFNAFEVLISKKSPYNLNEFALFYGNDHSHDNFKQIGKFQTENILYPDNPYQRFIFSAVTARYLKVKIISSHGDPKVIVNEFRLLGAFVE